MADIVCTCSDSPARRHGAGEKQCTTLMCQFARWPCFIFFSRASVFEVNRMFSNLESV